MDQQITGIYEALRPIMRAEHVAIIGASASQGKAGNRVIKHLRLHGYEGRISPVNPAGGEIEGLTCYSTIGEVPETVDCAIVLTPLAAVVNAVRECAAAGARACVIGAVGFAELDTDEGRGRQSAMVEAARVAGMRLIGPNTNGYLNRDIGLALGYNTSHGEPIIPGVISVAAHTGALFTHFARILTRQKVGISKFISVGNEADITILDCLEYFIVDENSKVIGLIIEGINDGQRFRNLLDQARRVGKPVVALKLGRSKAGAGATQAHATRLAGDGRAYDALFTQCGVAVVPSIEAFAGGCALLSQRVEVDLSGDQRLTCFSSSGAGASMLADLAEARYIPLAVGPDGNWEAPVAGELARIKTNQVLHNPLDTGSLGGRSKIVDVFETLYRQGINGPTIGFTHTVGGNMPADDLAKAYIDRKHRTRAPCIMISPSGLGERIEQLYIDNGILMFHETAVAYDTMKCHYATLPNSAALPTPIVNRHPNNALVAALDDGQVGGVLDELESSAILREAGVPMVASYPVATLQQATRMAAKIGYPVVLKAVVPGVAHKSKMGFVSADLAKSSELCNAFRNMRQAVKQAGFGPRSVPYVLQPMKAALVEFILGVIRDAGLGHFLLIGLGGLHAEALAETVLLPVPMARSDMERHIFASRIGRVIAATTSGEADVMASLLDALEALQGLIATHGEVIEAIDVNPMLVTREGCQAVDGLVICSDA